MAMVDGVDMDQLVGVLAMAAGAMAGVMVGVMAGETTDGAMDGVLATVDMALLDTMETT